MGIGGLDKEFNDIFRRAFASRVFPPALVEKLGIQHVKGLFYPRVHQITRRMCPPQVSYYMDLLERAKLSLRVKLGKC